MPIVIDEVIISVNVDNKGTGVGGNTSRPAMDKDIKQQIIEECVEQVMDIMRQQEEP